MRLSVYLPLVLSVVFALSSTWLARRLPPMAASRVLSVGAAVLATASTLSLAVLACSALAHAPYLAERGHWSSEALAQHDPVPVSAGLVSIGALFVAVALLRGSVLRRTRRTRAARAICRACLPAGSEVLVLDDATPRAFAVPGRPGSIVVSSGMLRALNGTDRRVLLEHERAHLRHRHHRYQALADLAAALNPVLSRVRNDVAFVLERWADEEAASRISDRAGAARSLAKAALAAAAPLRTSELGLAFDQFRVGMRVVALQQDCPSRQLALSCAPLVLSAAAVLAAGDAAVQLLRVTAMLV